MRSSVRVSLGLVLIAAGVLFTLNNLELLAIGNFIWSGLLGLGGLVLLAVFLTNRRNWWAVIPSLVLLGVASIIMMDTITPQLSDRWGGSIILGAISLSFWLVYLSDRRNWWAIIPGGVLLTLAGVASLPEFLGETASGGFFFLGLGLTFALLAIVPTAQGRMRWAIWPAGGLLLTAVIVTTAAYANFINFLWPAALILVGLLFIYRSFVPR